MKERIKRKRILYVPGMISLVLIPLFCFYHFYKTDAFKVQSCIAFFYVNDSINKEQLGRIKRNYKTFYFEKKKFQEFKELKKLRFFLRNLVKEYYTINGAKIHFGSKTDYDLFISVQNIMIEEKVMNWSLYKDDIYAFSSARPPKSTNLKPFDHIICGNGEANKDFWLSQAKEAERKRLLSLYKKNWMIFLAYLGIVFINIFALVKFNKNKYYHQKRYI
ncbi:hypothetical protein FLAT13_02537 [Flavobacterium salmonis]|uniref:Uncharacterized protein n=2 Tax=Flavobacterium salmonis TaxID=2654844 RepID=A0A6V6Z049_9FLAO|nr:hypothetical protein FLAT13_02537 [Flavobacterium salmonis]